MEVLFGDALDAEVVLRLRVEKGRARMLERFVRELLEELEELDERVFSKIRYAIATPMTVEVIGDLPKNLRSEQILDSAKLREPSDAILDLCFSDKYATPLGDELFTAIIDRIAPSATFDSSPAGVRQVARARMERRLGIETRALESLDVNRRVLVTGGAGSGKTRLAMAWARRAFGRDERTLVTCYNDPLGDVIADELSGLEDVTVAPFLRYLESAPGISSQIDVDPVEEPKRYWEAVTTRAIDNLAEIDDTFDTIIVDEAQDFSPIWLALLEELLDHEGPGRILMLGDPGQNIRRTGFRLLANREGWTRAELLSNNRNSPAIATLLRSKLGGAASPNTEPYDGDISRIPADTDEQVIAAVESALAESEEGETTWVLTTASNTRDLLRWRLGLVAWEDRSNGVICETVYRLKGLEADRVILVASDAEAEKLRPLLYAGVSRALERLVVIGSEAALALT